MHLCYSTLLLTYCVAVLDARRADVDLNRIRLVKVEESANNIATGNFHSRRSANLIRNDNDDRGRGFLHQQTHQRLSEHETPAEPRQTIKVYEPKEDPRLFYQSDAYLKEIVSGQANNEVAEVYPRNDVVSGVTGAGGDTRTASTRYRNNGRSQRILASTRNLCIKCPAERTLIAKPGSDRVIFQKPKLTTCSERRAPKNVHFVRMYGPAFGTLLGKGSHTVVGKVMYKGLTLQLCRMEVQVVTQTCSTPEYLRVNCDSKNVCNFTCQNKQFELYGKSSLVCGDNLQWKGTLPTCIERSWCEYPAPPAHGRLSCIGAGGSGRLTEGARCKARCRRGWRWTPRVTAVCSRGQWTSNLICQPRHINWSQ